MNLMSINYDSIYLSVCSINLIKKLKKIYIIIFLKMIVIE